MIVFGFMDAVNVYVEQSSDKESLTLSEMKSVFRSSSMVNVSKFVEDQARCSFNSGCQTRHVNCANILNALH
jgi:hypothetical protein